jgi:hypothetical protein
MGLYTMIADNLATPFQTTVLGMEVTVGDIDLTDRDTVVAHCIVAGRCGQPTTVVCGAVWGSGW